MIDKIPKKGEVLTALTHFWLTEALENINHHLWSSDITPNLNWAHDLKKHIPDLPLERSLVVKDMSKFVWPFEMIYRHHIGGSVFKKYQETGTAGGHKLPPGLAKWSKLEKPIFTPSTKEEIGNDINVDANFFHDEMSKKGKSAEALQIVEDLTEIYAQAYSYAEKKGILILDTKIEVAGLMIIDEILTPDSSRFGLKEDWEKAMTEGRDPYFYDKQIVRDWGMGIPTPFGVTGINKLKPENQLHVEFVHTIKLPEDIISETTRRYLAIFEMLVGCDLQEYQKTKMKI